MYFNAIHENKILAKISEFTVLIMLKQNDKKWDFAEHLITFSIKLKNSMIIEHKCYIDIKIITKLYMRQENVKVLP